MTASERFRNVMDFKPTDRLPVIEWAPWWDKTLDNWRDQGLTLPNDPTLSSVEIVQRQLGLDLHASYWLPLRSAATPAPIAHGAPIIHSAADYRDILPTLFPRDAIDFNRLESLAHLQQSAGAITWYTLEGFFWWPRVLMGIEPHLFSFYDEPELYHQICGDLLEYAYYALEMIYSVFVPDYMTIAEDMSYNNGPMLSEAMFDEFLLPYYKQLVPFIKKHGTRVFVDSDGDISRALPWFERAGIEGILPLERQAGVDLMELRQKHPRFLFIGHFDKMTMPLGEDAMRREFERLLPIMQSGGFIPSVDHQTPPGVTLAQYEVYVKLLNEYCIKAAQKGLS
ncbi:hypothetical protein AGMMS49992_13330 [Clostridia bacterium]|nr:hypothetical protein AGMMS49992_13330 [Clostridia bacterium]